MWRSRSRMRQQRAEAGLVQEVEAFLTRRYKATVTRGGAGVRCGPG